MSLRTVLFSASAMGALALTAGWSTAAYAQPAQATEVQEVTVTGSFIRGTPEDAAIPVQVVGRAELEAQGRPSVLELLKTLPISGPTLGESNQFSVAAQGRSGGGNINLRGLGAQRTLVLLNGRRFSAYTSDTNFLPVAAIGRVELLKDGAAATYGSDAIGGVANFITRTDVRGLEVSADYRWVDGSDGDYTASVLWGWRNDSFNVLLAGGYQHRSLLRDTERSYVQAPYVVNPSGWSVLGNPGAWTIQGPVPNPLFGQPGQPATITGARGFAVDANCAAVGGTPTFTGTTPACYFSYLPFDNLVEEQDMYQLYGEVNYRISDDHRFHAELLYSRNSVPHIRFSPGYPPTSGPNGPGSVNVYSVPASNPGFNTFLQQTGNGALVGVATGALATLWRPFANGGNPSTSFPGGQDGSRLYEEWHAAASLRGNLGPVGYDASVTWISEQQDQQTTDILIDRLQRSLNGLGGPGCSTNTPGANGCQYFNPFSNAYPSNPALGLTNPGYVSANANDPALVAWLFDRQHYVGETTTWVGNIVFNGNLGWRLPGGQVGWAVGGQYRHVNFTQDILSPFYNANLTPCPIVGQTNCAFPTGPYIFLGQNIPLDLTQSVWAAYAELHLPITDTIDSQLAVRYEHYSGDTGSTTNPFPAHWDPKLRIPRGQVVAAASIVSPKY